MDASTVHHNLRALAFLCGIVSGVGCSGDTTIGTGPGLLTPSQAYFSLVLNQHAVNLALVAPYTTVSLNATPLSATGTPLTGLGPIRYHAADSTVTVDSMTGLVTAHYVTTAGPTFVVASLQSPAQNVTFADTVFLQVTDTAPRHALATFTLQPAPGDSARRPVDFRSFLWLARSTDAVGDSVCTATTCPLLVYYASSNPLVAAIDRQTGQVTLSDTGHVVFTATTLAYGVLRRDSVAFTVDFRQQFTVTMDLAGPPNAITCTFNAPHILRLGVGAVVTFQYSPALTTPAAYQRPVDIIFDNSAALDTASVVLSNGFIVLPETGKGNIPAFGGDTTESLLGLKNDLRARRFPIAGTYRYHSSLFPSDTMTLSIGRLP